MKKKPIFLNKKLFVRQRGVSLIVVLMLLVIVSLLGVASMQIVMMGERAARSDRDMQLAWQGAEAALVDAEIELKGPNSFSNSRTPAILVQAPVISTGCNATGAWRGFCAPTSGVNYARGALQGKPVPSWLTVDFTDTSNNAPTVALGAFTGRIYNNADQALGKGIQPALAPRYVIEDITASDPGCPSCGMTTSVYKSSSGDADAKDAVGRLYRVTGMGFGPRSDIQAVLQTVYRN